MDLKCMFCAVDCSEASDRVIEQATVMAGWHSPQIIALHMLSRSSYEYLNLWPREALRLTNHLWHASGSKPQRALPASRCQSAS
jgi:hypothetical protein